MTKLNLPKPNSDTPASLLASLVLFADELDRRLAFGTGTWTWTGVNTLSPGVQVTHELSYTPVTVLVTPGIDSGLNFPPAVQITARDATTFTAQAATIDGQTPGFGDTCQFDWLAIR